MILLKLKWQNKLPSFINRLSSARTQKGTSKWKKYFLVEAQTPWKWDKKLMMKKGKTFSPSYYLGYYLRAWAPQIKEGLLTLPFNLYWLMNWTPFTRWIPCINYAQMHFKWMLNDLIKLFFSLWVIETITWKFMLFQNEISFIHGISLIFFFHL